VLRALLGRGHAVTALVLPGDPMDRIRDLEGRFDPIFGRLSDLSAIRAVLTDSQPDACIHLAWYAEPGKYLDAPENVACLSESLAFLQELFRAGCRQAAVAGTCAEYEATREPAREEETPLRPATLYAAAKCACYWVSRHLAAASGARLAWARLYLPYGPGEDLRRLVPAAIRALRKGNPFPATAGDQVRDFIHVGDAADAFCSLVERGADGPFNIASGRPVTVRALLEILGRRLGRPDLVRFGERPARGWDPPVLAGDTRRLRALGWGPRVSLEEGLDASIRWMADHDA
jgi:nucleoside-diphosphate-sugar epimerase